MTTYRKPTPYRKSQVYRGVPPIPPVLLNTATYGDRWDGMEAVNRGFAVTLPKATQFDQALAAPFSAPEHHCEANEAPFSQIAPRERDESFPWGTARPRARDRAFDYQQGDPGDRELAAAWGDVRGRHARATAEPWTVQQARARALAAAWDAMEAHQADLTMLWRAAAAHGALVALPWGPIGSRSAWIGVPWPAEPPPPTGGPDGDPITVPMQAVYIMIPTIEAMRLPDNVAIPILAVTITGDLHSWAWTFTAAIPASALAMVDPGGGSSPTQIQITVSGYTWTFYVEGVDDNRRFGSRTLNIRGRSRSAGLAYPYAPLRTFTEAGELDASQLATNELTPYGWTLAWNAPDWLVPGGTFSYQDLAPIDALGRVAASIGAAVLSDPASLNLSVQPQYPISPWNWGSSTPYAILPASILTQGDGAWQGGNNANGIYVYAENAGYGALVKLTGTDGAKQIPMVVERLTISADPVRERGRIEIARAGRIKTESRVIPLFPAPAEPGLIPLGSLLEVHDSASESWTGQVMGVRINADRAGSAISVRQTLTLERQFRA